MEKLWNRFKADYIKNHGWKWWMKKCDCGADLHNVYLPSNSPLMRQFKSGIVKRCASDLDGDRTKCPHYREHDQLLKEGKICYVKENPENPEEYIVVSQKK